MEFGLDQRGAVPRPQLLAPFRDKAKIPVKPTSVPFAGCLAVSKCAETVPRKLSAPASAFRNSNSHVVAIYDPEQ